MLLCLRLFRVMASSFSFVVIFNLQTDFAYSSESIHVVLGVNNGNYLRTKMTEFSKHIFIKFVELNSCDYCCI
jgi:hypothetical protein